MFAFDELSRYKIVPVIAIDDIAHALPLADALIAGGLPVAEITFRSPVASEVIRLMTQERPQMIIGAGTVLSPETLDLAQASGAVFGVAPGLNPQVVARAKAQGFAFMPGVATPSDIEAGLELGCVCQKFFPAEALGGVKMLSALSSPYQHTGVRFMPTGGVSAANVKDYFSLKTVLVVGGTWIAKKEDMVAGRWDVIKENCIVAREALSSL
jgi:2-dehydro-3-deoxyphosphogluconate aldolase/(4S)-4-hydroxy-2-oxoglutarate aldolase